MYNKYLEAFITVADCCSLTKASKILYISPTAIMKQINQLENHLNLTLFIRSNKGLLLSDAGKSLYEDAVYMVQYSKESVERAQKVSKNDEYHIRIGTSLMNPADRITKMLQEILLTDPYFHFSIIPFNDYRENYAKTVNHLGEQIDVIAGVYGFSTWTNTFHKTLPLFNEPVCIAVSQKHKLANKKSITIEELHGESLFITEPGDSAVLDLIRETLSSTHPDIHFLNMKSFDLLIYNQCAAGNHIVLTTPTWASLHPLMKPIEVEWDYCVPYGIIYPLHPSTGVQKFIKRMKRSLKNIAK